MSQKAIFSSIALTCLISMGLHAYDSPAKTQDSICCGTSERPMRVTARHIEAKGVGYNQGYTTLEGFFSPIEPWNEAWVPFLDLRDHVFNNGKMAANAGLGIRYITGSRVWGGNAYYDYRNTTHQHYNQVSVGFESLGKIWDFRVNGYLPVGDTKSSYFQRRFDKFKGHFMYISRKREFAMKGANAEVGAHVDSLENFPFYFAAGPYYLEGQGHKAWGGELRAAVDIFEYVRIEGNTSYDNIFRWIGQGQVSVNIPFGGKRQVRKTKCHSCSTALALSNRALQRVDRNEIIPVDRQRKISKAIDPATGLPFFFIFVNNTSHSLGTYESPYPTLLQAQNASGPNDVIYVFQGDGTTTGMASGITLKNGQKLFGSGIVQTLKTTNGTVKIPVFSSGLPLITNSSGSAITCANNNEIAGVHLLANTTVAGINLPNIANVSIHQNIIDIVGSNANPPTSVGMIFRKCGGQINVVNNIVNQTNFLSIGINLLGVAPGSNYLIQNNQFLATVGEGAIGIELGQGFNPNATPIGDFDTMRIQNNIFVGQGSTTGPSGVGFAIGGFGFNGTGHLIIDSNIFSQQTNSPIPPFAPIGDGVSVSLLGNTGANITIDITNNFWKNTVNSTVPFSLAACPSPFTDTPPINMCIKLQNNSSDTQNAAYLIANSDNGSIYFPPKSGNTVTLDEANNVGVIETLGTVTPGTCQ